MNIIAHRGFGDRYPENTTFAAESASRDADAVEIDVRRCGSGELVASHFSRLRWVSDASGHVADHPVETLASLHVAGSEYGIPTFEEALSAVPSDIAVEVDLKEPGLVADVLDATDAVENYTTLTSFYSDTLWEARSASDEVDLTYNFDVRLDRNLHTAELLDCDRVNVHWSLCLGTDVVERAKAKGMDVYAWPVKSRAVAAAVGAADVEGMLATRPGTARWADRGRKLRDALA
ncbi:glycerophosphodiester phosphodiesterase [Halogeometricum sp. S1BR25-6]|uniref:Glycerophosphodiester phosphodiesterase n=1 Tax=Halogeometricum salsisoli TaxID=2950536 RepID=A0ABU2G9E4_9EURY|nr:glycerophosphodiester phosphodiesterase [Halogeometricum sp. S1BR25-6]MDS0297397.1 glycerophosphodiester phosphodiesterase [Halogeometricum sp. S1BR25-6]